MFGAWWRSMRARTLSHPCAAAGSVGRVPIAALWLAVETRRTGWLVATLLFATMAFLTKGIIAYVFVGVAVLHKE